MGLLPQAHIFPVQACFVAVDGVTLFAQKLQVGKGSICFFERGSDILVLFFRIDCCGSAPAPKIGRSILRGRYLSSGKTETKMHENRFVIIDLDLVIRQPKHITEGLFSEGCATFGRANINYWRCSLDFGAGKRIHIWPFRHLQTVLGRGQCASFSVAQGT